MIDNRRYFIRALIIAIALIFLVKLFLLQVINVEYKLAAENNIIEKVTQYPYRGLIYDRNGNLLVQNEPVYDLEVIPNEVQIQDTLAFCKLVGIDKHTFETKMSEARAYSYVKPSKFLSKISVRKFASIQDKLVHYPGFRVKARTQRSYPHNTLANALGYLGEISRQRLNSDTSKYYRQGDYIGVSGLEKEYEKALRGKRGIKYKKVNVRGIDKGSFKDGEYDTAAVPGKNLYTSIDLKLQQYGETLMRGKTGSIVAIEPSTGEILSLVSSPSYDPEKLTGKNYGRNFRELQTDSMKPLFNRPLMGAFPPGSIFKTVQALVALDMGVISPYTRFYCNRNIIACHGSHTNEDLRGAIKVSCNPYFYKTYREMIEQGFAESKYQDAQHGLQQWHDKVSDFGFGSPLGVDLPNEKGGNVPTVSYYDNVYGDNRWKFSTIYSNAIGQGELQVVPLQMANLSATIANRGYYYTPHLARSVGQEGKPEKFLKKNRTGVDSADFEVVVDAMSQVVESGTGQYRAKLPDIKVCGKTGTVQNSQGPDHSVFISFAPKDDPQIAMAVYVEKGGQGARAAAGITGLMIENYLKGCTNRWYMEDYILEGDFFD